MHTWIDDEDRIAPSTVNTGSLVDRTMPKLTQNTMHVLRFLGYFPATISEALLNICLFFSFNFNHLCKNFNPVSTIDHPADWKCIYLYQTCLITGKIWLQTRPFLPEKGVDMRHILQGPLLHFHLEPLNHHFATVSFPEKVFLQTSC